MTGQNIITSIPFEVILMSIIFDRNLAVAFPAINAYGSCLSEGITKFTYIHLYKISSSKLAMLPHITLYPACQHLTYQCIVCTLQNKIYNIFVTSK